MKNTMRSICLLTASLVGASEAIGQEDLYRLGGRQFFGGRLEMDNGILMMYDTGHSVKLRDAATGQALHTLVRGPEGVGGNFGYSIAIDGDLAAVGTPYHYTVHNSGYVFLYDVPSGALVQTLFPPTGQPRQYFGWSVSISGGRVLVGAPSERTAGNNAGAAFLYDAATGQLIRELVPSTPGAQQQFGYSVALDGDLALVSGRGGTLNGNIVSGRAVLFNASTGAVLHELPTPNGASAVALNEPFAAVSGWDNFGNTPGFHGHGVVRVYDTNTGGLLHTLTSTTPSFNDEFGNSMEIEGTRMITGTEHHSGFGKAWVIDLVSGNFEYDLLPTTGGRGGDNFGGETALDGNLCVVAAINDTVNGGAVYAYSLDNLGQSFCSQSPNSTGYPATLTASGSASLADQSLQLRANNMPEGQFGIFFAGTNTTMVPLGGGLRCAGGALLRISPAVRVKAGELLWEVDVNMPGAQLVMGTYYAQTWYRDGGPLGGGTNLSEAVEITMVP